MTGKEKIDAAFSGEGSREIAAVICYEDLYIRDHWKELTSSPWWHKYSPDINEQLEWRRQCMQKLGQDWFRAPVFYERSRRRYMHFAVNEDGVYLADSERGTSEKLTVPKIGGEVDIDMSKGSRISTRGELEMFFEKSCTDPISTAVQEGVGDLSAKLTDEYGNEKHTLFHVASPFWSCYQIWGFEDLMVNALKDPALVRYACERFLEICACRLDLAKLLGAELVWIEECYTDMIGPEIFRSVNLPYIRALTDKIKEMGLKSIYYFTGDPDRKLDMILDSGADALAFEEGKKGFLADIGQIAAAVDSKKVLFGNIDSLSVLQDGDTDDLRAAIETQLRAAKKNGHRFVMSSGSPPTPSTPPEKIKLYCDLVHEMSKASL